MSYFKGKIGRFLSFPVDQGVVEDPFLPSRMTIFFDQERYLQYEKEAFSASVRFYAILVVIFTCIFAGGGAIGSFVIFAILGAGISIADFRRKQERAIKKLIKFGSKEFNFKITSGEVNFLYGVVELYAYLSNLDAEKYFVSKDVRVTILIPSSGGIGLTFERLNNNKLNEAVYGALTINSNKLSNHMEHKKLGSLVHNGSNLEKEVGEICSSTYKDERFVTLSETDGKLCLSRSMNPHHRLSEEEELEIYKIKQLVADDLNERLTNSLK